jgi:hypothetical protein
MFVFGFVFHVVGKFRGLYFRQVVDRLLHLSSILHIS